MELTTQSQQQPMQLTTAITALTEAKSDVFALKTNSDNLIKTPLPLVTGTVTTEQFMSVLKQTTRACLGGGSVSKILTGSDLKNVPYDLDFYVTAVNQLTTKFLNKHIHNHIREILKFFLTKFAVIDRLCENNVSSFV